jgi:hypothetical protein
MLNQPGGTQTAPGAPPRLLSLTETMAATGVAAPAPRSRSALYIVGLLGVVGVVVVLVVTNLSAKKQVKPPAIAVQPPPVTAPVEPVVEKPVEQPPTVVARGRQQVDAAADHDHRRQQHGRQHRRY